MKLLPSGRGGRRVAIHSGKRTYVLRQLSLAVAVSVLCVCGALRAQSLDKKHFAPLQAGPNSGTLDNIIGAHYWYFYVEPGSFQVTFTQGSAQGFAASGQASINVGFSPPTPGSHLTHQMIQGGGIVFSGSVTQRSEIGIIVSPPNQHLIRATIPYTITASGSAVFDTARSSGPPIVGVYNSMLAVHAGEEQLGATKFNADGTVEAANGLTGNWKLFDAESATYVVTIAGQRVSLHYDSGRGLVDASGYVTFVRTH